MILAGDIGASNTRLGLFENGARRPRLVSVRRFRNQDFAGLGPVVDEFLKSAEQVTSACFGVAGPVVDGKCSITNANWQIDASSISTSCRTVPVSLINDLEATAYGIEGLQAADVLILNPGTPVEAANAALIASGTGLGEAVLYWDGVRRVPSASEAGHADFSPTDSMQCEFLQYLWHRFSPVSWDRILCGRGLTLMYEFLRDSGRGMANREVAERMRVEDPAAVISSAALAGSCELSVATLDLYVSLYGAESGNLALRGLARGGVYIGGGIAPKIREKLLDGTFMRAFVAKDRMTSLLEQIPVYVILDDNAALHGAALYAVSAGR